jgi:hypothetical protein
MHPCAKWHEGLLGSKPTLFCNDTPGYLDTLPGWDPLASIPLGWLFVWQVWYGFFTRLDSKVVSNVEGALQKLTHCID